MEKSPVDSRPADAALAKLARTALGLSDDWIIAMLKDVATLPRLVRSDYFTTTVSTSAVTWNPASQMLPHIAGYPLPSGCFSIWSQIACGRERDGAILELLMAGWWCHYESNEAKRTYLLPRPDVKIKDGRIHCEDGPAVIWPDATARHLYYLEGVEVPKEAIIEPLKLPDLAVSHENAEIRRVLTNLYGHERLMKERGKLVQEDDFGKLWGLHSLIQNHRGNIPVAPELQMVEVQNSTPESDGSFRRYMLRVPPTMKTAKEAVAWSFNMSEKEYAPEVQT